MLLQLVFWTLQKMVYAAVGLSNLTLNATQHLGRSNLTLNATQQVGLSNLTPNATSAGWSFQSSS